MHSTPENPDTALARWSQEGHENSVELATMLGVSPGVYENDSLILLGPLQEYVSRLPLDQFEQDDWITVHSDLASYLADVLISRHGAAWQSVPDSASPRGFRYLIKAQGLDGSQRYIDPYEVVLEEFRNPPIQIARMIANAEASLGVVRFVADR
jgi:hypothetical protein